MGNCNTPYDDVFRTMLIDCKGLIIPVVNEIFGGHYTGNEKIVLKENEIFLRRQQGEEEKRITDSSFDIVDIGDENVKQYHIECQSTSDGSMLIRMFEYDSQLALKNGELENGILNVNFPNSAIIYLRKGEKTPDIMQIRVHTPGGEVSYEVQTLYVTEYDIETIFEKKLLFLLPFHIFSYEKQLEDIELDKERLQRLKALYIRIISQLEKLCWEGEIDEYTKVTICEMSEKVIQNIASKYQKVKKEVTDIMGGKVLEHQAKTIFRRGEASGELKGKIEEARSNALEFLKNGVPFEVVEKSIKALSHEELMEIYIQVGKK